GKPMRRASFPSSFFGAAFILTFICLGCETSYTAKIKDPSMVTILPGENAKGEDPPLLAEGEKEVSVMDRAPPWMSVQLYEHKKLLSYDIARLKLRRTEKNEIILDVPDSPEGKVLIDESGDLGLDKKPEFSWGKLSTSGKVTLYYASSSYVSGDTRYSSSYEFFLPLTYETDWSNIAQVRETSDYSVFLGLGLGLPLLLSGVALTIAGGVVTGQGEETGKGAAVLAAGILGLGGGIALMVFAFATDRFKKTKKIWPNY
ncbi:MAG: hypothetical protein ABIJ56_10450, partial [Pseudomonadota bacterium]